MRAKICGDKEIVIREIGGADIRNAKKFQVFINSLIEEEAKILLDKKVSLKDEKDFINIVIKKAKARKRINLVAECNGAVVGTAHIELDRYKRNHIGKFGIAIVDGYRGMGLGTRMMGDIIKLSRTKLKPRPKLIRLEVYSNNEPAINLYKKMGFKIAARVPKQIQWNGKLVDELVMLRFM